jgi:hypothetical protein
MGLFSTWAKSIGFCQVIMKNSEVGKVLPFWHRWHREQQLVAGNKFKLVFVSQKIMHVNMRKNDVETVMKDSFLYNVPKLDH